MSKFNNCTFIKEVAQLRIERLKKLLVTPLNKFDVADKLAMHSRTAHSYLTHLHQGGVIYIAAWDRSRRGPATPCFALRVSGDEVDTPRPRPRTDKELQRMYRQRTPQKQYENALQKRAARRKSHRSKDVAALFGN